MNENVNIYNINFSDFIPTSENDADDFINDLPDEGTALIFRKKVPAPVPDDDEIPQIKNNQRSENSLTGTLYSTEDHSRLSTLVKLNDISNACKMVKKSDTVFSESGDQHKRGMKRKLKEFNELFPNYNEWISRTK